MVVRQEFKFNLKSQAEHWTVIKMKTILTVDDFMVGIAILQTGSTGFLANLLLPRLMKTLGDDPERVVVKTNFFS